MAARKALWKAVGAGSWLVQTDAVPTATAATTSTLWQTGARVRHINPINQVFYYFLVDQKQDK
jgi:hypothetical protein